jgi:hypothetical protein
LLKEGCPFLNFTSVIVINFKGLNNYFLAPDQMLFHQPKPFKSLPLLHFLKMACARITDFAEN